MKRAVQLTVMGAVVSGAVIVTTGAAQVYPVRLDEWQLESQQAVPTPPSLVLADGGVEFPDGTVQATAAQVILVGSALIPVTGQTMCWDELGAVVTCGTGVGLGQDGDLQRGLVWPNPRFTDNGDGTVSDNLTGLIWLDEANCFGTQQWADALATAAALFDGCTDCGGTNNDCGLTDGSLAGQWRLPNVRELQSLVHYGVFDPAVPNTAGKGKWVEGDPFSGLRSVRYWSSTTYARLPNSAWTVGMYSGFVKPGALGGESPKTSLSPVWLVRGGAAIGTTAGARLGPVRRAERQAEPQPTVPTQPSLVLAGGGIEFPDGSVQTTATQLISIGPALIPATGQTICYDAAGAVIDCATEIGPGQDGDLQAGVRWPNPRFTKNGDGTVTDNLTGLIWLEDADCAGAWLDWPAALAFANTLFDGSVAHNGGDCGLSDGSGEGAWRLPNLRELYSLVHCGVSDPAVPNTEGTGKWVEGDPFSGLQPPGFYWSSTKPAQNPSAVWVVNSYGDVSSTAGDGRVWPVRGGQ